MPRMTGGEAIIRMLQAHGIELAFGMGGFQLLPYYDALARQDQIRHLLIRDERDGAFAADGYARIRNRPAVADATLGPGATNLITAAAESFNASIPLVLLTGEVNSGISGRGATQESDQFGMLAPTTKLSVRIDRIERIPEQVRRAIGAATGGRPGPVHVDIAEDVAHGEFDFQADEFVADPLDCRVGGHRIGPDPSAVRDAARLVAGARAPVILAGGGIHLSEAYEELRDFAETGGIPVATTISGKGAIAETHPLALGVCGRFSRFANDFIRAADLLIVVGSKLGEIATNRWTLLQQGIPLVRIDIDPLELTRYQRSSVGIWADASLALRSLTDELRDDQTSKARRPGRAIEVATSREQWMSRTAAQRQSDEEPMQVARVLHEVMRVLPSETILVADGGFAAHWSAIFYDVPKAGRQYIANRGHASIGYGLPGAIGARLAAPDVPVVALCGDNGFAMCVAELETARRANAPVIALVLNNSAIGYVKALQHGLYEDRFLSVDFLEVDFAAAARAFGCEGRTVTKPDELAPALRESVAATVPTVLDIQVTRDPGRMLPGVDSRIAAAMD